MINKKPVVRLIVLLAITNAVTTGCATYKTIEKSTIGSPKFFSGARLDLHALNNNEVALKKFNVSPPKYPALDLPGSILADIIISPLTGGMAAYEIIIDAK